MSRLVALGCLLFAIMADDMPARAVFVVVALLNWLAGGEDKPGATRIL